MLTHFPPFQVIAVLKMCTVSMVHSDCFTLLKSNMSSCIKELFIWYLRFFGWRWICAVFCSCYEIPQCRHVQLFKHGYGRYLGLDDFRKLIKCLVVDRDLFGLLWGFCPCLLIVLSRSGHLAGPSTATELKYAWKHISDACLNLLLTTGRFGSVHAEKICFNATVIVIGPWLGS